MTFIGKRREELKGEIHDLSQYQSVAEETFSPERIDEIYDLFYSDKVFNFYGREEPCFMSYVGKKTGNYNWVASKYDKPGPEFYSLEKGVTFENCPVFSTRLISYNHPLKDSPIPFMPEFCFNSDIRKMFWVSHDQLIY